MEKNKITVLQFLNALFFASFPIIALGLFMFSKDIFEFFQKIFS